MLVGEKVGNHMGGRAKNANYGTAGEIIAGTVFGGIAGGIAGGAAAQTFAGNTASQVIDKEAANQALLLADTVIQHQPMTDYPDVPTIRSKIQYFFGK